MIKHFCDRCGGAIGFEEPKSVLYAVHDGVRVTAKAEKRDKPYGAVGDDYCKYCIIDIINRADNRPTQA